MNVRLLDEKDVTAFRALRLTGLKTDPEAFGASYEEEEKLPLAVFKKRLEQSQWGFTVGGFCEGKLVCVVCLVRGKRRKEQHKADLVAMYCEAAYRGTGLAKEVVTYLLTEARKIDDLKVVHLMVNSENVRAKKFYASFGFKKYGTEPKALFYGARYFAEDLMYLDLKRE